MTTRFLKFIYSALTLVCINSAIATQQTDNDVCATQYGGQWLTLVTLNDHEGLGWWLEFPGAWSSTYKVYTCAGTKRASDNITSSNVKWRTLIDPDTLPLEQKSLTLRAVMYPATNKILFILASYLYELNGVAEQPRDTDIYWRIGTTHDAESITWSNNTKHHVGYCNALGTQLVNRRSNIITTVCAKERKEMANVKPIKGHHNMISYITPITTLPAWDLFSKAPEWDLFLSKGTFNLEGDTFDWSKDHIQRLTPAAIADNESDLVPPKN